MRETGPTERRSEREDKNQSLDDGQKICNFLRFEKFKINLTVIWAQIASISWHGIAKGPSAHLNVDQNWGKR